MLIIKMFLNLRPFLNPSLSFSSLSIYLLLSFFNSQLQHFQEAALVNQSGKEFCRAGKSSVSFSGISEVELSRREFKEEGRRDVEDCVGWTTASKKGTASCRWIQSVYSGMRKEMGWELCWGSPASLIEYRLWKGMVSNFLRHRD